MPIHRSIAFSGVSASQNVSDVETEIGERKKVYFMILTEERQAHLAHLATDKVWGDDIADCVTVGCRARRCGRGGVRRKESGHRAASTRHGG